MEEPVSSYPFSPEEYPGKRPNYSYFLSKDFVHELHILPEKPLFAAIVDYKGERIQLRLLLEKISAKPLECRYAIIGYGSNACPSQMTEKNIFNLPVIRASARNIDIVYTYEKTTYKAVPATIVKSPNTFVEVWVSFLDQNQLEKMDDSEGRKGGHYELVELRDCVVTLPNGLILCPAFAYVANKKGIALKENTPIALAPIPTTNRRFEAVSQTEMQKIVTECERGTPEDHLRFDITPLPNSPTKFEEKPYEILSEFLSIYTRLSKPSKGKSNKGFVGNLFAEILTKKMRKYVSSEYKITVGPLWISGLEWIEWDAAVITQATPKTFDRLFDSKDIVALFELKTRGIYGRKHPDKGKTVQQVIRSIEENFCLAKKHCSDLKNCFYVSLQERSPKRKGSIDYYRETKKLEPEIVTCILFQSPLEKQPHFPYPNEWNKLVGELNRL